MIKKWLSENIDNSGLVIFRILLGLLIVAESFGAILLGWVEAVFIQSKFTFNFIGFDFLQILHGEKMYSYFFVMGIFGLLITFGLFYRFAMASFTIMWTTVYLIQKESYNNHYYFLILICVIMIFLPANGKLSVDAKLFPKIKQTKIPRWMPYLLLFQLAILYFYAAIAKFYPDWLDGTFTKLLLSGTTSNEFLLKIFLNKYFYLFIAYAGILFDLLIVPLLLFKKTRTIALAASLSFHLFNAIFLQIGIFPFFALSFSLFFYLPEKIRKLFFKNKLSIEEPIAYNYSRKRIFLYFLIPFLFIQFILPLRHHLIEGDVLWTEEGHRLSWRMMLRKRDGFINFKIKNNDTGEITSYDYHKNLSPKQANTLATKPDFIWQYCQRIKQEYSGKNISIFIDCKNNINNGEFKTLIDPKQDFAKAKWNYFWHNEWVLLH